MTQLFQRSYEVTAGNLQFTSVRVAFTVRKSLGKEPNTCELKLFNLSADSRAAVQKKGSPVILKAGYTEDRAVIFSGVVRTVDHLREGPDWITVVKSGDGETAYQFARFSNSYGKGTPVAQVIRDAAAALSIGTGNLEAALAQPLRVSQFVNGYTAHGSASATLFDLLRSAGFSASIQNGALQVLKGGSAVDTRAVLLSPETGLLGSPEHSAPADTKKAPRVRVSCLLQPQVNCGGLVQLQSDLVQGVFRVENLEHLGDTHGKDWITKMELRAP